MTNGRKDGLPKQSHAQNQRNGNTHTATGLLTQEIKNIKHIFYR